MTPAARFAFGAALAAHVACASELQTEPDDDADVGGAGSGSGNAGRGGSSSNSGSATLPQGGAGRASGGATSAGRSGGSGVGGGGNGGQAGAGKGGSAGAGTGGASGTGGATGASGSAGQAGSAAVTCDEASVVDLMSQYTTVTVASNACLKLTIPSAQIKKITMQPDSGTYPLPFSWSNCTNASSGAFTANYANQQLMPVSSLCPVYVKLAGTGPTLHVQWWGD